MVGWEYSPRSGYDTGGAVGEYVRSRFSFLSTRPESKHASFRLSFPKIRAHGRVQPSFTSRSSMDRTALF